MGTKEVGVAAPIASQVLGEVLPYLEVKRQEEIESTKQNVQIPDVTGLSLSDAKIVLKELNLEIEIIGEENLESHIIDQLPKTGIQIQEGTRVTLYIN